MYPRAYPPAYAPPPPTSGKATAALICGVVSVLGGFCLVVPPLLAILLGHAATRETRSGVRGGHGMAVAGLIMGYVMAVPVLLGGLWLVLGLIASVPEVSR